VRVDEQQTAAENFQVESLSLKALQAKYPLHLNKNCLLLRAVASGGGSGARPPHLKSVSPPFHVWPPGCCIHPIQYFQNVAPLLIFGPPLLLNLGDGPAAPTPMLQHSHNRRLRETSENNNAGVSRQLPFQWKLS